MSGQSRIINVSGKTPNRKIGTKKREINIMTMSPEMRSNCSFETYFSIDFSEGDGPRTEPHVLMALKMVVFPIAWRR